MSNLKANVVANLAGSGVTALTQLICAPLFVRFLGIDAYGLIGFFLTLQASFKVLDLGLTPTLNRQLARYSVQPENADETRDFVRTLEVIYWLIGILVGIAISAAASVIASRWIKPGALPVSEVRVAVILMGVQIAVQWPLSLYQGGLLGLQRQVQMNAIRGAAAIGTGAGALLVLWLISPSILVFFAWQVLANLVYVIVLGLSLWMNLPPSSRSARFDLRPLRGVAKFAGGMSGTAVAGVTLTQVDKIVLSKLLPLDKFGYYTLAALVANSLRLFVAPVFNGVFPRLSALVARQDQAGIRRIYHQASQLMSVLIFPLALELSLFAPEVLRVWTGSSVLAALVSPVVVLLVAGNAINGIMYLPYALQLANGWTSLGFLASASMCVLMVPTVYVLAIHFGGVGAAAGWLFVNVFNFAVAFPLTHRRLLRNDALTWLGRDVCTPLVAAICIVLLGRLVLPFPADRASAMVELLSLLGFTYLVTTLSVPSTRGWTRDQLRLLTNSSR